MSTYTGKDCVWSMSYVQYVSFPLANVKGVVCFHFDFLLANRYNGFFCLWPYTPTRILWPSVIAVVGGSQDSVELQGCMSARTLVAKLSAQSA